MLGHASIDTAARYFRSGSAENAAVIERIFGDQRVADQPIASFRLTWPAPLPAVFRPAPGRGRGDLADVLLPEIWCIRSPGRASEYA